jgi:hypothetical protein
MIGNPARGVQVTDHGHVVRFSVKSDAMVQANYPTFTPEAKPRIDTTTYSSAQTKHYDDQADSPDTLVSPYYIHSDAAKLKTSDSGSPTEHFLQSARSVEDDITIGVVANVFYYYEITVKEKPNPKNTVIAIGLATKPYPDFRWVEC